MGDSDAVMLQFKKDLLEIQAAVEHRMIDCFQELLEKIFEEKMEDFTDKEQQKQQEERGVVIFKMESSVAALPEQKEEAQRGLAPKMGLFLLNKKIGDTEEDLFFRGIFPWGLYLLIIKLFGSSLVGKPNQLEWKKNRKKEGVGGTLNDTGQMILDWNGLLDFVISVNESF